MKAAAFLISGELPQPTRLSIFWSHKIMCAVNRCSRRQRALWVCQFKTGPEVTVGTGPEYDGSPPEVRKSRSPDWMVWAGESLSSSWRIGLLPAVSSPMRQKGKRSHWHLPKNAEVLLQHLSNRDHLHTPSQHVMRCMRSAASWSWQTAKQATEMAGVSNFQGFL